MHRIDNINARRILLRDVAHRSTYFGQRTAKVLPAMCREQDDASLMPRNFLKRALSKTEWPFGDIEYRINYCIASYHNTSFGNPFLQQVFLGLHRWGEVQITQPIGNLAVDLFGVRRKFVPRSQSGFYVSDPYTVIERGQASCHCRCGITLDEHPIWFRFLDNRV